MTLPGGRTRCPPPGYACVMSYDDGLIACTDTALIIRHYYFPVGSKRLPYTSIREVRSKPMTALSGKWRFWGSGDLVHWANLDLGRAAKSVALVVTLSGLRVRPVITPDDPEAVLGELAAHGVRVTNSPLMS